jgi:hypothetical protein
MAEDICVLTQIHFQNETVGPERNVTHPEIRTGEHQNRLLVLCLRESFHIPDWQIIHEGHIFD